MSKTGSANRITRRSIIAIASVGIVLAAVVYLGNLHSTTNTSQRAESHPAHTIATESPVTATRAANSSTTPTNAETDRNQRLLSQAELDAGRTYASAPMEIFDSQEAFHAWVASQPAAEYFTTVPNEGGHVQFIIHAKTPTIIVDQKASPDFERWPMMYTRGGARWSPEVIGAPGSPACWPLPHCDAE